MRASVALCLAVLMALSAPGAAYARERPPECQQGMRCEDPDWSGYSMEDFREIDFAKFADGSVPESSLDEGQLACLEESRPTVIHRPPVKADAIDMTPVIEDEGLIALTRRVFEEEGVAFHPIKLM